MISGLILNTQRLSTEDGPGIRSTVFFKGCPLHCAWCHNPESISRQIQTQWFKARCISCHSCLDTCPNGCLTFIEDDLIIDRENCQSCWKCVEACPSGALEIIGKTINVDDLLVELLKDRVYYEKSGGGVTLSGGEPTYQPEFSESLLCGLKECGIFTAIDTCGLTSIKTLYRLLPYTDLVLFDLKLMDPSLHRKFTGSDNKRILKNLSFIRDYNLSHSRSIEIWIRTPIIPGVTDSDDNLNAIGRFVAGTLQESLSRWELCAFNNLCRDQYHRLGKVWAFAKTPLITSDELEHCVDISKSTGVRPDLIFATGATRVV
jgi:pyruvate formate lyase activating enzyme